MEILRRLYLIVGLAALLMLVGTLGFYLMFHSRGASLLDCLYMTAISISTVGFGEILPVAQHPLGRPFTIFLIFGGMGILAYALSKVTAFFVEGQLTDILRRNRMEKKIDALRDHYLVVGGGATGRAIVQELCAHGYQVVVVDSSDKGEQLPEGVFFVEGDATHDEVLHRANIDRCRGLFVALPSGKDNLYLTVTARMMRPDLAIIAKAKDDVIAEKLRRAGATGVVSPQVIGGLRMASVMIRPDVVDFLDQMLRAKNRTLRVAQVCVGEKSSLKGITVRESDLRSRFNLLILAIKKEDGHFEFNPRADHLVRAGDTLIVLGDIDQVGACQEWAV